MFACPKSKKMADILFICFCCFRSRDLFFEHIVQVFVLFSNSLRERSVFACRFCVRPFLIFAGAFDWNESILADFTEVVGSFHIEGVYFSLN